MLSPETGEFAEPMPGGSSDFVLESEDPIDLSDTAPQLDIKLPHYVVQVVQVSTELSHGLQYHSVQLRILPATSPQSGRLLVGPTAYRLRADLTALAHVVGR